MMRLVGAAFVAVCGIICAGWVPPSTGAHTIASAAPQVCNGKKFDKVYETCRRGLVDKFYEDYTKNRETVNQACDIIATQMTCEDIPLGDDNE